MGWRTGRGRNSVVGVLGVVWLAVRVASGI